MSTALQSDALVLAGAALLACGVLLAGVAERVRAPALLLFLGLGMLIGDDGLELVSFADADLAQSLAVVALVVILFEGGLSTPVGELRSVVAPAGLLATVGVVITASVVAGAVLLLTDADTTTALLLGAVVASTDAAAVFAVLRSAPVPRRLALLLEAESGANDPMAVLLTVGIVAAWEGDPTGLDWVAFGLRQLGGGLIIGGAVGVVAAMALRRIPFANPILHPVLAFSLGGLSYGIAANLGASGFLAVYVTGLAAGSATPRRRRSVRRFHEGLASVAQISLFLMLGLLMFPSQLPDVAVTGVVVVVALLLLARPLAVALCLPWFGFDRRSGVLAAWAGLRGAVPIVLATFPLTAGHPDGAVILDVVFLVVLLSATVQGLTIAPLARRLGLAEEHTAWDAVADVVPVSAAGIDVAEVDITSSCGVIGQTLAEAPLPGTARVAAVLRDETITVPDGSTTITAGDRLIVVAPSAEDTDELLTEWARGPARVVPRG